jgi:hypothetical protein
MCWEVDQLNGNEDYWLFCQQSFAKHFTMQAVLTLSEQGA